jgi:UDP-GlcNAc:undecaprenyl-phosphate GlcNAc-1-phosphate transferase
MLAIVAGLCLLTTVLGILSAHYAMPWLAVLGIFIAGSFLVLTRSFGHAECQLVLIKATNMTRSFFITPHQSLNEKHHNCVSLQGNGKWHLVWEPLVDFAMAHNLAKIKIDLNLSWLHEGYHASWSAIRMPDRANQVQLRWPLVAKVGINKMPMNIGTLHVVAEADSVGIHERIADLSLKLADLEPQIQRVVADLERQHVPADQVPSAAVLPANPVASYKSHNASESTPLVAQQN